MNKTKAKFDTKAIPGYEPPPEVYEVTITEKGDGVELGYYSTYDKAMNGMLDEQ